MTKRRYDLAKGDVAKVFGSPREIVDDVDLSTPEKIELLQEWEMDLRGILVAAEEGMTRDAPSDPGVTLRRVHAALEELGASPAAATAPTKAGGA